MRWLELGGRIAPRGAVLAAALCSLVGVGLGAQEASEVGLASGHEEVSRGPLFPRPLLVEHHVVHRDGRGDEVRSGTVSDVYAGSFVVSRRPDGSKRIVDLVGRRLTATHPLSGTYWTVSFDRLAELRRRAMELERLPGTARGDAGEALAASPSPAPGSREASALRAQSVAPELVVEELPSRSSSSAGVSGSAGERAAALITARPGVRHVRVRDAASSDADADPVFEAWVDPSVVFSPRALAALAVFERDALGGESGGPAARLDAARRFASGAFAVRTRRALTGRTSGHARSADSPEPATLEDAVTRVEWLEATPDGLLEVPGLVRVPHPLERIVAAGERERALLDGGRP